MRLQISLEVFNLTLYIVIVSFLINKEKEKHFFHNNQFNELKKLILTKSWWSSSPKVCGSDKIKNIAKVPLANKYATKICFTNLIIVSYIFFLIFVSSDNFLLG